MKRPLNMDRIAKALGAERRGTIGAAGGHFGALQLAADVQARFRVPERGGRATDPEWTERRLVPLSRRTLTRLEALAAELRETEQLSLEPLQLAALLLERATEQATAASAEDLVAGGPSRRAPRAGASGR